LSSSYNCSKLSGWILRSVPIRIAYLVTPYIFIKFTSMTRLVTPGSLILSEFI
jgi:hypothetical protein